jgi:hypothetical protein
LNDQIHLIVRLSEDGSAYATSPQLPGLLYGRSSIRELHRDLDGVLAFHLDRSGPFAVVEHQEEHYELADGELVVRVAVDEYQAERAAVARRVATVARMPVQAKTLVTAVTNRAGEAVYVCAVPSDTMGWLAAQLDPRGDALVAALTIADDFLFTIPLAVDDGTRPAWRPSEASADTRLVEIMQQAPVVTPLRVEDLQHAG